jgi:rhodanese-related sulfurtransferase
MNKVSMVTGVPPAASQTAYEHFYHKLAFETDPSDVYADMQQGKANFVLVDVRSPEAYAERHAAGAISIPHPQIIAERLADYPEDTLFVVYCWGPGCNGADKAALKLSQLGRPVKIMIGGIEYWADKERLPVESTQ